MSVRLGKIKYKFFATLFILSSINCAGQIKFEEGYFIDISGQKTNCLIRNVDWKYNPKEFSYKLDIAGEIKKGMVSEISEFAVSGTKFLRFAGKVDRSSDDVRKINYEKEPLFNKEELFLKVLVGGKATLLSYEEADLQKFFYKSDSFAIEQLIYKRFLVNESFSSENKRYREQLKNRLICATLPSSLIDRLEYDQRSLVNFFMAYNDCHHSSAVNTARSNKRDRFQLMAKAGINFASLKADNPALTEIVMNTGSKTGLKAGVEAEFVLPFNNNKWTIVVDPTFQYYKSENKEFNTPGSKIMVSVDYTSIELPLGLRYYLFINDNSRLYINAFLIYDRAISSKFSYNFTNITKVGLDVQSGLNEAIGVGYSFKRKINLEARYETPRNILASYSSWNTDYSSLTLAVSLKLF